MTADKIVGMKIRLIVKATFQATGRGGLRALPGSKNIIYIFKRTVSLTDTVEITLYSFYQLLPIFAKKRLN